MDLAVYMIQVVFVVFFIGAAFALLWWLERR